MMMMMMVTRMMMMLMMILDNCLPPLKIWVNQFKGVIPFPGLVLHLHFQVFQQFIWVHYHHNQYNLLHNITVIIIMIIVNPPRSTSSSSCQLSPLKHCFLKTILLLSLVSLLSLSLSWLQTSLCMGSPQTKIWVNWPKFELSLCWLRFQLFRFCMSRV